MAIKPLNRKAEALMARSPDDVQTYNFGDCCPGFLPGWEVGEDGMIDPCNGGAGGAGWLSDLPACHPCYWTAQVPDQTTYFDWMDGCANVSQDWETLCTVPD